jgi:hypothetical protein
VFQRDSFCLEGFFKTFEAESIAGIFLDNVPVLFAEQTDLPGAFFRVEISFKAEIFSEDTLGNLLPGGFFCSFDIDF